MKILDLFSGLNGWGSVFEKRGHEVVSIDLMSHFKPTIAANILDVHALNGVLYVPGPDGEEMSWTGFDAVLASPPCEPFSVASIGHHWMPGKRTTDHKPKTLEGRMGQAIVIHTLQLIRKLGVTYWWMENPRGMLRKLPFVQDLNRVTVTYCQYGETRMKPTDLWGVWPATWKPKPPCKNGAPCHESAPRGSRTGTQGIQGAAPRALIPYELSLEVCLALEAVME